MVPTRIAHVDLDAFFAAVAARDAGVAGDRPLVVAGRGARGVVAAANYPARAFGIRAGQPLAAAQRACGELVVADPDREAYEADSRAFRAILREVTEVVEATSIDEAFLDLTAAAGDVGDLVAWARRRVHAELGLTATAGVAGCTVAAKVAGAEAKPDGQKVIPVGGDPAFLASQPLPAIPGVGPKTAAALARVGADHVADLRQVDDAALHAAVGQATADWLRRVALGEERRHLTERGPAQSVGQEVTVDGRVDTEEAEDYLGGLAVRVSQRLAASGQLAAAVETVAADRQGQRTRRQRLAEPTRHPRLLFDAAVRALDAMPWRGTLHRVGLRALDLTGGEPRELVVPAPLQPRWYADRTVVGHPTLGTGLVRRSDDTQTAVQFDRLPAGEVLVATSSLTPTDSVDAPPAEGPQALP